jgi:hypothetical protein
MAWLRGRLSRLENPRERGTMVRDRAMLERLVERSCVSQVSAKNTILSRVDL